ncbi:hypothetical protein FRACYDRAFT_232946 [Fragilariopsis cylindrus CCMP1102]|uniref:Uncharacterized protein n=1 Tax=Fragilariopsis cylindrus CCMP1102 TaxID=635003 RepID=A0A1E7FXB9_9STRA|nr:hypothetical protein FRACYDRAFT_232946 [Fragilariopsis cylindrus CCMP1102]|eukprot:OEU22784.1 hypothetical protein FRACYDRAFT_232946 [Fragilariopsis cylindrus CCMP1102]
MSSKILVNRGQSLQQTTAVAKFLTVSASLHLFFYSGPGFLLIIVALPLRDVDHSKAILNDTKHWGSVSTAHARFELYLQQIAKVTVSPVEMNNVLNSEKLWPKSISPNPFKVFIYTVEQLHDQNLTRGAQFRLDLQEFLRLKKTLVDFSQVPKKNAVNA